jgi:probable rRNA maturation factor
MAVLDILIEDPRWSQAGLEALAQTAFATTLDALSLSDTFEISLMGCDDARMAALNASFRDRATATNVLSWPSVDLAPETAGQAPAPPDPSDPELGDIALAYDTCAREAQAQGKEFADHVTHLIVHGTLHLLGYDHIRDADAALMEALETRILAKLDIADPY